MCVFPMSSTWLLRLSHSCWFRMFAFGHDNGTRPTPDGDCRLHADNRQRTENAHRKAPQNSVSWWTRGHHFGVQKPPLQIHTFIVCFLIKFLFVWSIVSPKSVWFTVFHQKWWFTGRTSWTSKMSTPPRPHLFERHILEVGFQKHTVFLKNQFIKLPIRV